MATVVSRPAQRSDSSPSHETFGASAFRMLQLLGSLKLTVTLFALSLITVLVGTLAQDEMNMFEVKQRYFLSWVAPMHLDDFFPQAFFPHSEPYPGVIPFPGGALIGLLLMVNLLAAKTTRFRIHSSGTKLVAGVACLVLGTIVTGIVVVAGHSSDGLQGTPPMSYSTLWASMLAALTVFAFAFGFAGRRVRHSTLAMISYGSAIAIGLFVIYSLMSGFRIGDPGLRIVWQLTKGLGAGVILMVGCLLVFDKQGGNVLLHLGVGLLMVGQFAFGDRQLEQRLSLVEGESSNTLLNLDAIEMTFIERLEDSEKVIPIPGSRLRQAAASGDVIDDPALPANVRVVAFYENSTLKDVGRDNLATKGVGLEVRAAEMSKSGGTDSAMNLASAYVELIDRKSGESFGTFLISQSLSDRKMLVPDSKETDIFDTVTIGDTDYDIGLKFHREVKPYWVQLEDVRRVDYSGTDTPRDYSSFIRIVDPETGEDRKERVWMNNPLRYRGETFYQSNYTPLRSGKEMTGIQVVRNSGWLIPYVACSITALGMLVHFMGTLTRFLSRRERETRNESSVVLDADGRVASRLPIFVTLGGFLLLAVYMLIPWQAVMLNMRPTTRAEQFDMYAAGKIPTQYRGRVMPLDAYARQTLKAISSKESLPLDSAPGAMQERVLGEGEDASSRDRLTAMHWLMEVATASRELRFLPMFRIDAEEVRSELGLERRKSKLYSLDEISANWSRVAKTVEAVVQSKKPLRDQTFKERKLLELDSRTREYTLASACFELPTPEDIPPEEFAKMFPGVDPEMRVIVAMRALERRMDALQQMQAPRIVPPSQEIASAALDDPDWSSFGPAVFNSLEKEAAGGDTGEPPAGVEEFADMIASYGDRDAEAFNAAVDQHLEKLQSYAVPGFNMSLVSLERWLESQWPTGVAMVMYLITLVLGLVCFAADLPRLRQAVWIAIVFTLLIHTVAIVCRIVITGRAPVINIYSSAVFIGWAAVLFGLVFERIFRYGIGNVVASASGVLTLLVAYGLNTGDTMPVLQAVLDTQFWLATHVISVTLGYVATLVAGTVGIAYLGIGWLGGRQGLLRDLYRCCYGAACFGILFSFVGTVLGGLWADDSWGRFWGWDPKENGALLIVIWNALMLHARWDGMVGPRGFAALAIGGNIVTAWSWFGTNELGIGLHSYGFTQGVLMWLTIFIGSQFAILLIDACLRFLRIGFSNQTT